MRVLISVCLLFTLVSCGNDPITVKGHLTLTDSDINWLVGTETGAGSACEGMDGYDDITQGAEVVVHDSKGERVAVGHLGAGKGVDDSSCRFPFTVTDVDTDSKIMSVEITHRGEVTFKRSDAGTVEVTLG